MSSPADDALQPSKENGGYFALVPPSRLGRCTPKCTLFGSVVILLIIMLVAFLGATALWSVLYTTSSVDSAKLVGSGSLRASTSAIRNRAGALARSVSYARASLETNYLVDLFDDVNASAPELVTFWMNLALGGLGSFVNDDFAYDFGVWFVESETTGYSISYSDGGLELGNFSGDGNYRWYLPEDEENGWDEILAGNWEDVPMILESVYELDPVEEDFAGVLAGDWGDGEPFMSSYFWGSEEIGEYLYLDMSEVNLLNGSAIFFWGGIDAIAFSEFLRENLAEEVQRVGDSRGVAIAWLYDISNEALLGVSTVESVTEIVVDGRPMTPEEFPNPVVSELSAWAYGMYEEGELSADTSTLQVVLGSMSVDVEYLDDFADLYVELLVIRARPTWTVLQAPIATTIGSGIGFVVLFAVLLVVWLIGICSSVRWMRILRKQMQCVQRMELDNLRPPRSLFSELDLISSSFGFMVQKLIEYRAYLPYELQGQEDEDMDQDASSYAVSISGAALSDIESSSDVEKQSETSSSRRSLSFVGSWAEKVEATEIQAVVCCICLLHFELLSHSAFASRLQEVLRKVNETAISRGGQILEFVPSHGEIFVIWRGGSFGRRRRIEAALVCAHELSKIFAAETVDGPIRIGIAVTFGGLIRTTMGTRTLRKLDYDGIVPEARLLAHHWPVTATSGALVAPTAHHVLWGMISDEMFGSADGFVSTIGMNIMVISRDGKRKILVAYRTVLPFQGIMSDGEWMYDLARKDRVTEISEVNALFAFAVRYGDSEEEEVRPEVLERDDAIHRDTRGTILGFLNVVKEQHEGKLDAFLEAKLGGETPVQLTMLL